MSQNRGVLGQKNHGVTLFEVVISMAVIGIMIIVFVGSLRVASTSMVKSRELIRRS
nr:prepilin-type N-terminal cleavage/methylation domain-containing protein [Elusimicrobiota bacterium]